MDNSHIVIATLMMLGKNLMTMKKRWTMSCLL